MSSHSHNEFKSILWVGLLLWGICFSPFGLKGQQIPNGTGFQTDNRGLLQSGLTAPLDSTGLDSLPEKIDIQPDTRYVEVESFFRHKPRFVFQQKKQFETIHLWDEIDRLPGFVQSIGQYGKPYKQWEDGLDARFLHHFRLNSDLKDPIFDAANAYQIMQTLYLDTKTPYVNVQYMQGPDRLTRTQVIGSQNIKPWWNFSFMLKRRISQSVYRDLVADHTNVYLNSNYHSQNLRYYLFGEIVYNQLNDEINGGVPHVFDETWNRVSEDGVISDTAVFLNPFLTTPQFNPSYNGLFFKSARAPLLADAQRTNRLQYIKIDQYYQLIRPKDSTRIEQNLTLRGKLRAETNRHRFVDQSIDTTSLKANIVPVYPTLAPDSNDINDNYVSRRISVMGQLSYSLALKENLSLQIDGGIDYEYLRLLKDTTLADRNKSGQEVNGKLTFPLGYIEANIRQTFSNILPSERTVRLNAELAPPIWRSTYKFDRRWKKLSPAVQDSLIELAQSIPQDSTLPPIPDRYRPLKILGETNIGSMNPSLFQAFIPGDSGSTYRPGVDLVNQQITHVSVGLRYQTPAPVGPGDTLLSSYFEIRGFVSRLDQMIYYDRDFLVQQAANGEALNWVGGQLKARLRFLRKFYLESDVSYQIGQTNSTSVDLRRYTQSIPQWHGVVDLFYDNSKVSFARRFRLGLRGQFMTRYVGQTLDPLSGQFFPTDYEIPPYVRLDVYTVLNVWGVPVFAKFSHANEFAFVQGYFTTPTYPMLERAFTVGLSWSFFD
ncbi:MAG: putative porin [Bacteroidota bacterium]